MVYAFDEIGFISGRYLADCRHCDVVLAKAAGPFAPDPEIRNNNRTSFVVSIFYKSSATHSVAIFEVM